MNAHRQIETLNIFAELRQIDKETEILKSNMSYAQKGLLNTDGAVVTFIHKELQKKNDKRIKLYERLRKIDFAEKNPEAMERG